MHQAFSSAIDSRMLRHGDCTARQPYWREPVASPARTRLVSDKNGQFSNCPPQVNCSPLRQLHCLLPLPYHGRHIELCGAGTEQGDHLVVGAVAVADVHEVSGQQVVTVAHQVDEHMQKVNAVEHYGIVSSILVNSAHKIFRVLCPVHGAVQVMADVVAIVPALYIVLGVDAGNAVLVGVTWVIGINKGMLRPVARHGYDAEGKERQYEHHQRCRPVNKAQSYAQGKEQYLAPQRAVEQAAAVLAHKVGTQVVNAGEHKRGEVLPKPAQRIALKGHGGALIIGHVVLRMVHAYVVGIVGLRRLPEERAYHPRQKVVEETILRLEPRAVAGAVHHESVRAFEHYVVEVLVKQRCHPPGYGRHAGPVEHHGQRYQREGDAEGKVNEWKIARIADERNPEAVEPAGGRSHTYGIGNGTQCFHCNGLLEQGPR